MKIYLPIAKIDAAQRMVMGYASTEARDDQGEIVKREALQDALGDYMKFANIREMHQLSAVGKAKDAAVDERGLYIGAKIVDDQAWNKVIERVYNGFSIGGKVTQREAGDPKTITGLRLDEISLVDRPANPEAVFDCWKRSNSGIGELQEIAHQPDGSVTIKDIEHMEDPVSALKAAIERVEALVKKSDGNGKDDGDKPYGDVKYADPGYQGDKKKRYPIDTVAHIRAAWNYINKPKNAGKYSAEQVKSIKSKIVSAWKDKIDPKGPPSAAGKAAHVDTGFVAQAFLHLDAIKAMIEDEGAITGQALPEELASLEAACAFLKATIEKETAPHDPEDGNANEDKKPLDPDNDDDALQDDDGDGDGVLPARKDDGETMAMSAIATSLAKFGHAGRAQKFARLAKARHSAEDQQHLDIAYAACDKARGMDGISAGDKDHCDKACDALKAAGARESSGIDSTQDTARNPTHPAPTATPPAQEYRPGVYTTVDTSRSTKTVLELIEAALGKRGGAHKALMDVAHNCLKTMTDGKTCAAAEKAMSRHSTETMGYLQNAHDHVRDAGAKCDAAGQLSGSTSSGADRAEEEGQGTKFEPGKAGAAQAGDIQKRYDALTKAVADLAPRLDAIAADVVKIKNTPLPPLTARSTLGLARIEKGRDGAAADAVAEDDAALAARIAKMSPDQKAMLLIKASRMQPYRIAPGGPQPLPAEGGK